MSAGGMSTIGHDAAAALLQVAPDQIRQLQPGASAQFDLTYTLLHDSAQVAAVEQKIAQIQGDRVIVLDDGHDVVGGEGQGGRCGAVSHLGGERRRAEGQSRGAARRDEGVAQFVEQRGVRRPLLFAPAPREDGG